MPATTLKLRAPTWGDRLHLAYREARRVHGYGFLSYNSLAERISELVPTNGQRLLRLEEYDDVPPQPAQRQIAWLELVAMGYDPADFGLTDRNVTTDGFSAAAVRALKRPWSD